MADENLRGVDLFGDPVPASRDKAGRPEHVWTVENSNKINLLFAMGYDQKDAALAIGISKPTLRKHYFSEVQRWHAARLRLTATQLARLNKEAAGGNVSAIKELFKRLDKVALKQLSDTVADRGKAARAPKLGKKEERSKAAAEVVGKFAPPPAPLLN